MFMKKGMTSQELKNQAYLLKKHDEKKEKAKYLPKQNEHLCV